VHFHVRHETEEAHVGEIGVGKAPTAQVLLDSKADDHERQRSALLAIAAIGAQ
jgi:hypothetical protein